MATNVLGLFNQIILDGSVQTLYTVPSNHTLVPKTISFASITSDMPNVTIWFVASGESDGNKNIVLNHKVINPHETIFFNSDMYLQAGFTIKVQVSIANSCNAQLSGVDMS